MDSKLATEHKGKHGSIEVLDVTTPCLSFEDSRSAKFRDTTDLNLAVDPFLDNRFGDHEPEERREFVVEAIEKKLEPEDED